ncbi:MAG: ABC transporter permease [Bacillota bacterium]
MKRKITEYAGAVVFILLCWELLARIAHNPALPGPVPVHVIIPACLPSILTATRISLGTAIAVLFFTETLAGASGLGYFILDGWHRAEFSDMFAGILAMGLLGVVLYGILDILDRFWCNWQRL